MNKLTPIDYVEDALSHQPRIILSWVTEGIVINNIRYSIKEFRLKKDSKLYAVIAENKYNSDYFEVQLCPDEATLKDIYKSIKDNKVAITKEITDRTSEVARVDKAIKDNTKKIDKEITDRKSEITRVDGKLTELQGSIKPIVSGDSGLLTVTTDNSQIKLTPKHDEQKQNKLTAGEGITIQDNVISAAVSKSKPKKITGVNKGTHYIYATIDDVQPLDVFNDGSIVINKILNVFAAIPQTEEATTYSTTLDELGITSDYVAYTCNTTPIVNGVTIDVRDRNITLTGSNSTYVEFKVLIYGGPRA